MIFCKSKKSAQRTLENIIPFIEEKLLLKVNRKKTEVAHISKVKYLGYSFYRCTAQAGTDYYSHRADWMYYEKIVQMAKISRLYYFFYRMRDIIILAF